MPAQLLLVRHGETAWSKSGQHTGRTEISLTPTGEAEARALGERLSADEIAHVLTSPRERARRTCELASLGSRAEVDPDLAEWDYGDDEGRRTAEILAERPDWNLFREGSPGGETPAEVAVRADRVIARVRELDGIIAVFSHGHFGRVLAARWIDLPPAQAQHFMLNTASISILGYERPDARTPAILCWNWRPCERSL